MEIRYLVTPLIDLSTASFEGPKDWEFIVENMSKAIIGNLFFLPPPQSGSDTNEEIEDSLLHSQLMKHYTLFNVRDVSHVFSSAEDTLKPDKAYLSRNVLELIYKSNIQSDLEKHIGSLRGTSIPERLFLPNTQVSMELAKIYFGNIIQKLVRKTSSAPPVFLTTCISMIFVDDDKEMTGLTNQGKLGASVSKGIFWGDASSFNFIRRPFNEIILNINPVVLFSPFPYRMYEHTYHGILYDLLHGVPSLGEVYNTWELATTLIAQLEIAEIIAPRTISRLIKDISVNPKTMWGQAKNLNTLKKVLANMRAALGEMVEPGSPEERAIIETWGTPFEIQYRHLEGVKRLLESSDIPITSPENAVNKMVEMMRNEIGTVKSTANNFLKETERHVSEGREILQLNILILTLLAMVITTIVARLF